MSEAPLQTAIVPVRAIAWSVRAVGAERLLDGGGPAVLDAASGPAAVILDFGSTVVGSINLRGRCSTAARVRLRYGEDLSEALLVDDPFPATGWYHLPGDDLAVEAGPCTLRNQGRRTFRFVHIQVQAGRLDLDGAEASHQHHPVAATGWCAVADERLNAAWRLCRDTTTRCMQHYYEDGPKRDGQLWIGDARVEYLCNALLHGDTALAARSLRLMAAAQDEDGAVLATAVREDGFQERYDRDLGYMAGITRRGGFLDSWRLVNYATDLIAMLREYHDHSGDLDLVNELWPRLRRLGAWLRGLDPSGLKPRADWISDFQPASPGWWAVRGTLAMHLHWGQSELAILAGRIGDAAEAAAARAWLAGPGRGLIDALWCPRRNVYTDEPHPGAGASWHANVLAVLAGVASHPNDLLQRVAGMPGVLDCHAGFMAHWKWAALARAGLVNEALADARRWYAPMLENGATTTWDVSLRGASGILRPATHAMSHCHGWSAGLAWLLPGAVVGVAPASPGFATVEIRPDLAGLAWAGALVPTPRGAVEARWVSSPSGLCGEVILPDGVAGQAQVGGRRIPLTPGLNRIEPPGR